MSQYIIDGFYSVKANFKKQSINIVQLKAVVPAGTLPAKEFKLKPWAFGHSAPAALSKYDRLIVMGRSGMYLCYAQNGSFTITSVEAPPGAVPQRL